MIDFAQIDALTDEQVFEAFCAIRWRSNRGRPVCPHCSHTDCYVIRRRSFKCRRCRRHFSVTSGTIFNSRKLPLRVYLSAIAMFANARDGISARELSQRLAVTYKPIYVLAHKLREAMEVCLEHIDITAPVSVNRSQGRFRAITNAYVENYINEVLFRAGHHDDPETLIVADLLETALTLPRSQAWTGYFQRTGKRKPRTQDASRAKYLRKKAQVKRKKAEVKRLQARRAQLERRLAAARAYIAACEIPTTREKLR